MSGDPNRPATDDPAEVVPAPPNGAQRTPARPDSADPDSAERKAAEPNSAEPNSGEPTDPPAEKRRPASAAAAAASRARRIGGRPVPARPAGSGITSPSTAMPTAATTPMPAAQATTAASEPTDDADGPIRAARRPLSLRKRPAPEPAGDSDAAGPQPGPEVAPADRTDQAEPDAEPGDRAGQPVPTWLNWAPAGVLVAGALVMAVLLVVFSHGVWWGPEPGRAPSAAKVGQVRDQVQAAAKSCVAATNDYSYTALDAYETKALACTTGQFTSKLRSTIENVVKKNAPGIKAKQTTRISRSGIQSVTPDGKQWTILVFGQLSVVNANYPDGRTDPFGALVTMENSHGKWLMANLDTVSSPVSGG
jgi:hypothetical protein